MKEGFRSIYAGLGTTLTALIPNNGIYFLAYAEAKRLVAYAIETVRPPPSAELAELSFSERALKRYDNVYVNLISSVLAGAVTSLVTQPLWTIKARLQVQGTSISAPPEARNTPLPHAHSEATATVVRDTRNLHYRGTWHALTTIIKTEGPRSLWFVRSRRFLNLNLGAWFLLLRFCTNAALNSTRCFAAFTPL